MSARKLADRLPFGVRQVSRNVHVVECEAKNGPAWEQWFLLRSPLRHTTQCQLDRLVVGECFHNDQTGERIDPRSINAVRTRLGFPQLEGCPAPEGPDDLRKEIEGLLYWMDFESKNLKGRTHDQLVQEVADAVLGIIDREKRTTLDPRSEP